MRYHQIELFNRPFITDPDDSLDLAKWGIYEVFESSIISSCLEQGMIAVDIGAHIGYYSCAMANTSAVVWAFEPNPLNYAYLQVNAQPYPNIVLQQYAVSNESGKCVDIHLSPINSGDDTLYPFDEQHVVTVKVKTVRLDDLLERADFIKIDVQGSEIRALQGMEKLLSNNRPMKMAIEYYPDGLRAAGDNPVEMLIFLWAYGFKLWEIREGDKRLDQITSPAFCEREDLRRGYTNILAMRE